MIRVVDYIEFKRQLGKAGLSGRAFARLLDMNPLTIPNYKANGRVPVNLAVIAVLMATMAENGLDYLKPIERMGIVSPRKKKDREPAAN